MQSLQPFGSFCYSLQQKPNDYILFGIVILVFWKTRLPLLVSVAGLLALLVDIAIVEPSYLWATFNPVTLNMSVIALSVIAYVTAEPNQQFEQV